MLLKLFVSDSTPRSERAIESLRRLLDGEPGVDYELAIVDVRLEPEVAESEGIMATPTLVRELPLPARRIIGDLSSTELVRRGLSLSLQPEPPAGVESIGERLSETEPTT